MSDHREQIVDLDTPAAAASERAQQVRGWLVDSGWAVPGGDVDDRHPDEVVLQASPHTLERWPGLGYLSLVVPLGDVFVAGDGTGAPRCPACSTEQPSWDEVMGWIDSGAEPRSTCANCGWDAPLGDWDLVESLAPGPLAVVLNPSSTVGRGGLLDAPGIARALGADLSVALGGRWTHVHFHG